jgi:formylglycine-generating enzyme required for sulfatase activity
MRSLTEISLADAVKVLYYLKPERGSNDKIQLIISLLGFSIISDQKQVPTLIDNESFLGSSQKEVDIVEPTKSEENPSEAEQPIKNIEKLEVDVLREPQGQVIPEVIRTAESLSSEVYSMETIVFRNTKPSVQLLSPNNARAYIHDTFSSDVFSDEINIDIVIEQISRGTAPKVEFVKKKSFHGPVHVLIDRNRSMEPFEEDADSLYRYIQKLAGTHACEGYWCFDTPDDELVRLSDKKRIENYPEVPLPQTILILISDLGAARPFAWSPVSPRRWSASLRRLAQLFYRIIVVSPYPKKRLPELRQPNIGIVPWGTSRYATYSGSRQTLLDNFAVMMAPAAFMNKDLVRNARTTFYPGMYPGLEADLMFSWMMVVSNPLIISFRQETLKVLRQKLLDDSALRAKAVAFLARYRGKCQQYKLPGWLRFEEELMHNALEGDRTQVDDAVRRLIRTLTGHDDNVQLARWALSVANELPGKSSTAEDRQNLQIAAQLRLGIVPKKFKESGRRISWLLPKEKKVGIRQEDGKVRFLDNPEAGDNQISVPATVPRYLYIEGQDGTKERVTLWNDQNDVTVSVRLLPITISTLSGAQYRIGGPPPLLRRVRILIASASDVAKERKIVEEEIEKWNTVNRDVNRIVLEAVRWETYDQTTIGERPHEIIYLQIVDQCDFAIAIFHSRIGKNTGLAPGGTVEEVRRIIDQGKQVICWFSEMPFPYDVDPDQIKETRAFRTEIQSKALCDTYKDLNEFRQKVAIQLALYVSKLYGNATSTKKDAQSLIDADSALHIYQNYLKQEFGGMSISGSPAIASFAVPLSDTFVSLRLSDNWRSDKFFHSDIQDGFHSRTPEEVMSLVFKNHRLLVIIGDPGSGKTTLLKYYALAFLDGRYVEFGFTSPVPVFWLQLRTLRRTGRGYGSLAASLADWCDVNYLDEITPELCAEWLEASQTLILLDGLDEISDVNDRIEMCRWLDGMVKKYGNARFVVTTRSTGYRKGDGIEIVTPHVRADILDFSPEQQEAFLHRWFRAVYLRELPPGNEDESYWRKMQEEKADNKAATITAFLAEERNQSNRSLAANPLLLQIMANLWKEQEFLPGNRVKLIDSALDYLLDYRDRIRAMKPLLSAEDAQRVLAPVSLWMQDEVKQDEVDRGAMHEQVQKELNTLSKSVNAADFCRNLVERAGVLVEYGDNQYVFRLKTFREYLAAIQLTKNVYRSSGFLDHLVTHFGDDWWSEVFRFFIQLLEDAELFERFMLKLFDSPVTEILPPMQQALLLTMVREAPLKQYGELIKKLFDPATTPNRQRYLVECLKEIGKKDALTAVHRFENMESGTLFSNPLELDAHYILIGGGAFKYSVTKRTETVPDCWFAKYPVTNRLYRRFISYLKTGKLDDREVVPIKLFMTELANFSKKDRLIEIIKLIQSDKDLSKEFASSYDLDEHDSPFNNDDHPVVGITCYAAKAYCFWLSLMESQGQNTNLYRLPTEIEWEYAAAGKEGRAYPWGNSEPSPKLANYDNHERATTPVGSYPEGSTPEGLYDMAGNVAEWMDNWFDESKHNRALRGGAWGMESTSLRCSFRINFYPAGGHKHFGFRVVRPIPKP